MRMNTPSHPLALAAGAVLFAASGLALAAPTPVQTAAQHAGYASHVKHLKQVHLHLHHTINCLVGSKGEGFDAAAGDPCKGASALDELSKSSRQEALAKQALALARTGEEIGSYRPAHHVAIAVHELLIQAEKK